MKYARLVVAAALFTGAAFVSSSFAVDAAGEPEKKPAANKVAAPKPLSGEVVSINVETGELKLKSKSKEGEKEVTVQTSKETTQVKIDGASATLADLKPGMKVKVTPATGPATEIHATTKKPEAKPKAEKPAKEAKDEAKEAK
jgi:hypothetical protein